MQTINQRSKLGRDTAAITCSARFVGVVFQQRGEPPPPHPPRVWFVFCVHDAHGAEWTAPDGDLERWMSTSSCTTTLCLMKVRLRVRTRTRVFMRVCVK